MSNFWKAVLRCGGTLLVLGGVMLLAGWMMGGKPATRLTWNGRYPTLVQSGTSAGAGRADAVAADGETQKFEAGDITSLEVDVDASEVHVRTAGTQADVTSSHCTAVLDGGVLKVTSDGSFNTGDKVVITLPKDVQLENLKLYIGAGALTADGLTCATADLNVGAGAMTLTDFNCTAGANIEAGLGALQINGAVAGRSRIDCGMGSVKLSLAKSDSFGYAVDCGMGSVHIAGKNYSGADVQTQENADAADFFDIECGMGNVELLFA